MKRILDLPERQSAADEEKMKALSCETNDAVRGDL